MLWRFEKYLKAFLEIFPVFAMLIQTLLAYILWRKLIFSRKKHDWKNTEHLKGISTYKRLKKRHKNFFKSSLLSQKFQTFIVYIHSFHQNIRFFYAEKKPQKIFVLIYKNLMPHIFDNLTTSGRTHKFNSSTPPKSKHKTLPQKCFSNKIEDICDDVWHILKCGRENQLKNYTWKDSGLWGMSREKKSFMQKKSG